MAESRPMSDTITFHVPGIPQTAGSKRAFVIPGKNGGKARAIVTDDNPKGTDWRRRFSRSRQTTSPCRWRGR
jgi:hypothetical protein